MAKILVVDDDDTVLKVISRILSIEDHTVAVAHNRAEALAHMKEGSSFDIFILDFWLGNENALDIMHDLIHFQLNAPVLFLSGGDHGVALETSTALAEMQGACEFLYKPVQAQELLESVRKHI